MEKVKFIAETLVMQQICLNQQMRSMAEKFKEAGQNIKAEEKEEFFYLTSKLPKFLSLLTFSFKRRSPII
jgi:hypothetical protein